MGKAVAEWREVATRLSGSRWKLIAWKSASEHEDLARGYRPDRVTWNIHSGIINQKATVRETRADP